MNSLPAEQSLIGGLLIDPAKAPEIMEIISHGDFADIRHGQYFQAIDSLINQQTVVDVITVGEQVQQMGHVVDLAYLVEIAKNTPSTANLTAYARSVQDAATERKMLLMANEIAGIIHGSGKTATKLEDINHLVSAMNKHESGSGLRDAASIVTSAVQLWDERSQLDGSLIGYSTGFVDIDTRTMGLQAPDLTVIAAPSGKGKTTLAMNMVQAVAIDQHKPTLVFSLEMSGEQIVDRLTAAIGQIPLSLIKSGKVFGSAYEHAIVPAAQKIKSSNLYIDDRGGLAIGQIQAAARKFFRRYGPGLLVVDYIGLVQGRGNNRQEQIASVSGGLKSLAKELNIPVIALAQLNRNNVIRGDKRPVPSDLRDSAAIEHDADALIMLYEDEENNGGTMEAIFTKLRNGERGTDYLHKRLDINRFQDQIRGYQPRAPEPVRAGLDY